MCVRVQTGHHSDRLLGHEVPAGGPELHLQRRRRSLRVLCGAGQRAEGLPADTPRGTPQPQEDSSHLI